jgi:cytochrome c-type biogenesis protein
VLPLVPAYLSLTGGLGAVESSAPGGRGRLTVAGGAALFVAGFSAVFVALGLSATALGSLLLRNQVPITRVSGVVVLAMAVLMVAGTFQARWVPWRELRFHPRPCRYGVWAAPVAGAAFAFGWTPCIGPVLASVLAIAAGEDSTARGALLLMAYAGGLGVPFLVSGLVFGRAAGVRRRLARHSVTMTRAAAAVLAGYGLLLTLDQLASLTLRLQAAAAALDLGGLITRA